MPFKFSVPRVANPVLDVVFVHGLRPFLRTPRSDWKFRRSRPGKLWPKCLEEDVDGIRVGYFSYDAPAFEWFGKAMHVEDQASAALDILSKNGIGDRPVIFVTHSLGGLLVKELLLRSNNRGGIGLQIADSCRGVVFLATPHAGARAAVWAAKLRGFRPGKAIRTLLLDDAHLTNLTERYKDWAVAQGKIEHLVLRETQRIGGVLIVPPSSADPHILGVRAVPVNANHTTIASPRDRDDDVYSHVRLFLDRIAPQVRAAAIMEEAETARKLERDYLKKHFRELERQLPSLEAEADALLKDRNGAEYTDDTHRVHNIEMKQWRIDREFRKAQTELQKIPKAIETEVRADEARARADEARARAEESAEDDDTWT